MDTFGHVFVHFQNIIHHKFYDIDIDCVYKSNNIQYRSEGSWQDFNAQPKI